jgi:hypothetical protein
MISIVCRWRRFLLQYVTDLYKEAIGKERFIQKEQYNMNSKVL